MTGPMKEAVSASAAGILYAAGYPVARSGVIVVIGQYQMLMADACSGLHSMLSLAALGVLFTYLIHRGGRVSKGLMLAAVLPIAFAANLMRTATLLLVTYHGGDAVARQWHEAMGVLALLGALGLLVGLEACLSRIEHRRSGPRS
jgi:exosortase